MDPTAGKRNSSTRRSTPREQAPVEPMPDRPAQTPRGTAPPTSGAGPRSAVLALRTRNHMFALLATRLLP